MKLSRALVSAGRQGVTRSRTTAATGSPTPLYVTAAGQRNASSRAARATTTTTTTTKNTPRTLGSSSYVRPALLQQQRQASSRGYASEAGGELGRTALYDLHLAHGAKMVPFGGYEMPVQYSSLSVGASHHWTRDHASLFDVGHMVQHRFEGPGAIDFLQRITPGSLSKLAPHHSTLSALLWPGTGGIVDDTVITRLPGDNNNFYVVTNAGCREKDLKYLSEQLEQWRADGGAQVNHEVLNGWGLIALQGPDSKAILDLVAEQPQAPNLEQLYFGQSVFISIKGAKNPVLVSRGGYTGEDGFEISLHPSDTVSATESLLSAAGPERLQLAGLGARDSLRLEAGMCLYGHDLDDTTTPAEAALGWIVGKDRRAATTSGLGSFHGAEVVIPQLTPKTKGGKGVERRRIGLTVEKGAPAREGSEVVDPATGEVIGKVTSGCPSPTLGNTNIAMAYVKDGLHKSGTDLEVLIRGKKKKATVTKMPFVPSKYFKGTAPA